jgi:hypothetical protein
LPVTTTQTEKFITSAKSILPFAYITTAAHVRLRLRPHDMRPPHILVRVSAPILLTSNFPPMDGWLLTQAIHSLRGFAPSIQMSNSALLPNCVSIIKLACFMMRQRSRHGCRRPYLTNPGGERKD